MGKSISDAVGYICVFAFLAVFVVTISQCV